MNEKTFHALSRIGASGIVVGVICIVTGITVGVVSVVSGARALHLKKNIMF